MGSMSDPRRPQTLDRFRALEGESGEALDPAAAPLAGATGALPFVRCVLCHVDAQRDARTCGGCGADLGTPAQRAFQVEVARREREAALALAREQEALLARQKTHAREEARLRRPKVDEAPKVAPAAIGGAAVVAGLVAIQLFREGLLPGFLLAVALLAAAGAVGFAVVRGRS